jgi:hypothetical protein
MELSRPLLEMHSSEHSHAANDSSFTIYRAGHRIGETLFGASSIALPPLNFSPAVTGGLFLRVAYAASAFISL